MKFHSYCSYDGSPVGFVYGATDITQPTETTQTESLVLKKGTNTFIKRCFESGLIRYVQGIIPHTKDKVLLLKNLKASGEDGTRRYMNFALVYGEGDKYLTPKLATPFNADLLSKELAKTLIIDRNNEFGYQLDASVLHTFLDENLTFPYDSHAGTHQSDDNVCYINTLPGTRVAEISSDLGMRADEFSLDHSTGNETVFRSPAKKSHASSYLKTIVLLATILASIVAIVLWIVRRQ